MDTWAVHTIPEDLASDTGPSRNTTHEPASEPKQSPEICLKSNTHGPTNVTSPRGKGHLPSKYTNAITLRANQMIVQMKVKQVTSYVKEQPNKEECTSVNLDMNHVQDMLYSTVASKYSGEQITVCSQKW